MVSPDSQAIACPLSGRNSTYRTVQISGTGSATVATWIMTLFIQRAEHRDTQAIHAKLDELLRAEGKARDELTMVDQREPEERLRPIGRWRSVTDKIRRETP